MSRATGPGDDRTFTPDPLKSFYEQHPYPPPVDDLADYQGRWNKPHRRRAEHALIFPRRPLREDLDVLVAGCGTFQAARHAMRWPEGRVTGIDISDTSISHTHDLKQRHALDNLELQLLPIERIGDLGRAFDLIVCTGVLHHLADPDVGLAALGRALRPGGAMLIMVYGPYGRIGVTMMQEYARRLGVGTSPEEIRELALTLNEIPRDHPLGPLLRDSPDFRRFDAIADALLNPRDRSYSVPELFDFVERNGLAFGRWYRQAPYLARCGAPATTPHASRLAALPAREQYAAIELFRGTIARHSMLIHRAEDPAVLWQYGLGGAWQQAVPIRLAASVTVEEQLPAGAAAVLINRSHTHTDLFLPITEIEKRILDAIDGRRTIVETVMATDLDPASHVDGVNRFLQRLYDYDHVVLGASPESGST